MKATTYNMPEKRNLMQNNRISLMPMNQPQIHIPLDLPNVQAEKDEQTDKGVVITVVSTNDTARCVVNAIERSTNFTVTTKRLPCAICLFLNVLSSSHPSEAFSMPLL
ncbi:MAG: hypothetical protein M8364_02175 [Methylobacter sp.]|uniref:hypothetical protein n=1 Tax=Methylobacter sp. TaxID=2051955 RepID=UPI00258A33A7|nr:hypothetical protein [Methylobacter sp.]MCL7419700.1 hypothetical protein [Methylobacter sp.]